MRLIALLVVVLGAVPLSAATLQDIHKDKLPNDAAVQASLQQVAEIEPYVAVWSSQWPAPVPKEKAEATLHVALATLGKATAEHPGNEELLLTYALVAHYGYNMDIDNTHERALGALDAAGKLAPADIRVAWFRGAHLCETLKLKDGMQILQGVEQGADWKALPTDFWLDYSSCAYLTAEPSHALRALSHAKALHGTLSRQNEIVDQAAHEHMEVGKTDRVYTNKDAWYVQQDSGESVVTFTSYLCGMSFAADGKSKVSLPDIKNGTCAVTIGTGPYRGNKEKMSPQIVVIARPAKSGETLQDFQAVFMKGREWHTIPASHCPAAQCISVESVNTGSYGKEGDGYANVLIFERDEPEFPGLVLETPWTMPTQGMTKDKPIIFRPETRITRIPEKLYYFVAIDSSASVHQPALKDFDTFLKSLVVE